MTGSCTICGRPLRTHWGAWSHAKRHIREADAVLGRETDDYDEVRAVLAGQVDDVDGPQVSLMRWST